MRPAPDARASSAICAAFRSCVGVEAGEAEIEQLRGGDGIGGVQAEIADEFGMSATAQCVQQAGGPDQDRAIAAQQEIGDALFAGLEYAGLAMRAARSGGADAFERGTETVEIEIIERDAGGADVDGGVKLLRRCGPGGGERGPRAASRVYGVRTKKNRPHDRWRTSEAQGCLRGLKLFHGFAADLVQQRGGSERRACQFEFEFGKFVWRVAQAPELRAQEFGSPVRDSARRPAGSVRTR